MSDLLSDFYEKPKGKTAGGGVGRAGEQPDMRFLQTSDRLGAGRGASGRSPSDLGDGYSSGEDEKVSCRARDSQCSRLDDIHSRSPRT